MDATELAKTMLKWEKAQRRADELAAQIKAQVLAQKKSQSVGNVTASFRNGRKSYDYAEVSGRADEEIIAKHTEVVTVTKVDHRAICKEAGIEAPYTQGKPSVSLKLL